MTATDKELRKKVLSYVNAADHKLLKLMEAIAISYQEEEGATEPTNAQKEELDNRLKRYEEGSTEFYSWKEVETKLKKEE